MSGPTSATIVAKVGTFSAPGRVDRRTHRREMVRGRSTAPADDARPGVDREGGIAAHQLGCTGVDDLGALEPWHPAVAFADRRRRRIDSGHLQQRRKDVRSPDPAVGAVRHRLDGQAAEDVAEMVRHQTHHRATGGVERAGRRIRDPHLDGRRRGGAHLFRRRHRLDPGDVRATGDEPFDLLAEGGNGSLVGERRRVGRTALRSAPPSRRRRPAGPQRRRPRGRSPLQPWPARTPGRSAWCNPNRLRLQPNVLVRMMSAPASTKRWWSPATISGRSTFQSSGGSPDSRPNWK